MEDRYFITPDDLKKRIIERIQSRGLIGLRGIGTLYRQCEEDPNQTFDISVEVPSILADFGVFLNKTEVVELKRHIGKMKTTISLSNLLSFITPPLNDQRTAILDRVFQVRDPDNAGKLDLENLRNVPHVQSSAVTTLATKKMSPEGLFFSLIRLYEQEGSQSIPRDEFFDYYRLISASIQSDREFVSLIKSSWAL